MTAVPGAVDGQLDAWGYWVGVRGVGAGMRRYLTLGGFILVLAFAGWSLAWWLGRGEIEQMVDAGIDRLQEQGWQITTEEREVSGFPFGYGVRLTGVTIGDSESGLVLYLPTANATGTERVLIQFPESFRVEFPLPALARAADPALEDLISIAGEADDLVLVLMPDGTAELTADHLVLRWEDGTDGHRVVQSLVDFEATSLADAPGSRYRLHASEATIEAELPAADASTTTALASLRNIDLTGTSSLRSGAAFAEMLYAGADGQAEAMFDIGAAELEITTEGAAPGQLEWEADALNAAVRLTSGRIELDFEARGNDWVLTSPDPEMPLQGELSMELVQASYAMPMTPSEQPAPMALSLTLTNGMASERIWDMIDPKGVLPHAPASLRMGLSGTVRVTTRIDRLLPGSEPPFEIAEVNLDEVAADALGAKLRAAGELEIIQPSGRPLGEIRLGMTGLSALVEALGEAELISPDMLVTARAIMEVYLRQAAGDDAWTAVIDFTSGGTEVNGLKVR